MRTFITAMLAVALTSVPFGALAAEPPAPCGAMMSGPHGAPPDMAAMTAMHAQMHQMMVSERTALLQAISAQHRAMLAQTIGNLALSVDPDYDGAAKAIDAALSPGEAQSIVRIETQAHQQMGAMMQAHMQQMMSQAQSQSPSGAPCQTHMWMHTHGSGTHQIDPGRALLNLGSAGPMMGMRRIDIEKTVTH